MVVENHSFCMCIYTGRKCIYSFFLPLLLSYLPAHTVAAQAGLDYTKVAGRVFAVYSSRTKQLLQEQSALGSHTEHYGVAELIQSALKYVSTEHKVL